MTLIIGDTSADYYRYDYDPDTGEVGERSVFGDVQSLDGYADGSTLDADGGLWCALYAGRQLARFTSDGLDRTLPVPIENPTDVTFGGPELDRLYVVAVDGGLLRVEDDDGRIPAPGRPESRFHLA
jgi:sugar lactone lactonase YvrE